MTLPVEAALRALAAAMAVWASLRVLRVKNLVAQKAAWAMVLAASLVMPLLVWSQLTPAWADLKLPVFWASAVATTTPAATATVADSTPISGEPKIRPQPVSTDEQQFPSRPAGTTESHRWSREENETAPVAAPAPAPSATPTGTASVGHRFLGAVWILYLGGCAVLLSRLLWGLATSLGIWFRADRVELPANLDFPGSIRVNWSELVASPVNIGSGILLPADHVEWNDEKLRVVLAHERSHIEQRDFYLQLLAGLYAALTWFSPLGWWLKHKLSELGEAISDRAGLEAAASPSTYAGMLLEFAALPRPTLNGVGMAHSSNLSHRMERFLNESNFRVAFAGGRRALLMLAIPAMLIAASTFVRVQAAPRQASDLRAGALSQDQTSSQAPVTGQSNPLPAQVTDAAPGQEPAAAQTPDAAPATPMPSSAPTPAAAPTPMPAPPGPGRQEAMPNGPVGPTGPAMAPMSPIPPIHVDVNIPPMPPMPAMEFAGEGNCFMNGDSYVIVGAPGTKPQFCGNWDDERTRSDLEKARGMAHGDFLLFRHEGRLYVYDDPATVSEIEALEKSRQEVGDQMRALGKQMREAGEVAREAGRKARESAAHVPAPDLSKEIAELDAGAAGLKAAQGGTVSREQLHQVEREISAIQRRVMQAQMSVDMKEFNIDMAKFGQEQGKFGGQMGKLGAQMGQISRENSQRIRSIIDESLKDGKAKPLN
jgi:hypothetical protein